MDLHFDPLQYRYPSRRRLVYGRRGMVCASQPLAAQAGLDMIKKGGNAFDAALAAAACLAVVEPMSCNMGGDGFAPIWHEGKLLRLKRQRPGSRSFKRRYLKTGRIHRNAQIRLGEPLQSPASPPAGRRSTNALESCPSPRSWSLPPPMPGTASPYLPWYPHSGTVWPSPLKRALPRILRGLGSGFHHRRPRSQSR